MTQDQPPKHIWISNASLPQSLKDGVGEYFPNFPGDGGKFDLLEYVPKAEIVARGEYPNELSAVKQLDELRAANKRAGDTIAELRANQATEIAKAEQAAWQRVLIEINAIAQRAVVGGPVALACLKIAERLEAARTADKESK